MYNNIFEIYYHIGYTNKDICKMPDDIYEIHEDIYKIHDGICTIHNTHLCDMTISERFMPIS